LAAVEKNCQQEFICYEYIKKAGGGKKKMDFFINFQRGTPIVELRTAVFFNSNHGFRGLTLIWVRPVISTERPKGASGEI